MAAEWQTLPLGRAGVAVIDCDHRTPKPTEEGYPYVAIPQLRDGRIDLSTVRRISYDDFIAWTKRAKPAVHDVLLSRRTNPGETAVVPADLDLAVGQNLVLLRADGSLVHPEFLRWLVRGPSWWAQVKRHLNVGAVFDSLKVADIPQFELPIPPLPEQQAISHVLASIDARIELSHRRASNLDHLARALFQSWLIDLDPVRGTVAAGEQGLPETLAEEFPRTLVTDDLPEGWEDKGLDEIATFRNGLALQKFPPVDGQSVPVIKIAQLRAGHTRGADRASHALDPAYIVDDGDVLFSWSGSLECKIWTGGAGALNQHLFKVTSSAFPRWFYYLWIQHHLPMFRHIAAAKATTMGHIQRHHLSEARVKVPPVPLLGRIDAYLGPLVEGSWRSQLEARALTALRDALLPSLLSGHLRVPDPERILARVSDE